MDFILDEDVDYTNAIEPFQNMVWDFVTIIHPYMSSRAFLLNLLQPFSGIYNILKGALLSLLIIPSIMLLIGAIISLPFNNVSSSGIFYMSYLAALGAFKGVADIIRGATQIIFTPFTWFIKIPLRAIITLFKDSEPDYPSLNSCTLFDSGPATSSQGDQSTELDVSEYHKKIRDNIYAKKQARGVIPTENQSGCFLFFKPESKSNLATSSMSNSKSTLSY